MLRGTKQYAGAGIVGSLDRNDLSLDMWGFHPSFNTGQITLPDCPVRDDGGLDQGYIINGHTVLLQQAKFLGGTNSSHRPSENLRSEY